MKCIVKNCSNEANIQILCQPCYDYLKGESNITIRNSQAHKNSIGLVMRLLIALKNDISKHINLLSEEIG